jgi:hypothetical protein
MNCNMCGLPRLAFELTIHGDDGERIYYSFCSHDCLARFLRIGERERERARRPRPPATS